MVLDVTMDVTAYAIPLWWGISGILISQIHVTKVAAIGKCAIPPRGHVELPMLECEREKRAKETSAIFPVDLSQVPEFQIRYILTLYYPNAP